MGEERWREESSRKGDLFVLFPTDMDADEAYELFMAEVRRHRERREDED